LRYNLRTLKFAAIAAGSACAAFAPSSAYAVDGGTLRVAPRNGWKAFEVITVGNDPAGDGFNYAMPDTFDGIGALVLPDAATMRLWVNHENAPATVSEVNLNLANLKTAITNVRNTGTTGGVSFVTSARKAWDQWSSDGGGSFSTTGETATNSFSRFCSSQLHTANTFGLNRGFVDNIYMNGAEISGGRMFALDTATRNYYRLSSVGLAPGGAGTSLPTGTGGMPADPFENACLIDTGDTSHVALLLAPDGGSQNMQLYIGEKGKNSAGAAATSFLARNGLAYGNFYYLNGALPSSGTSAVSVIDNTAAGALNAAKLEDVDTNPNNPKQAVIGIQESGLFTFDFNLKFDGPGGTFNANGLSTGSTFTVTKVLNHTNDTDGQFGDADNVDWTKTTTLNGVTYANGLIFVNEDSGTGNGETWMTTSAGTSPTLIADTIGLSATETSGILDISELLGYRPGSVLLTSNQGSGVGSMSVLINPNATLIPEPASLALAGIGAGALLMRRRSRVTR
jgi:hypothetical protein